MGSPHDNTVAVARYSLSALKEFGEVAKACKRQMEGLSNAFNPVNPPHMNFNSRCIHVGIDRVSDAVNELDAETITLTDLRARYAPE